MIKIKQGGVLLLALLLWLVPLKDVIYLLYFGFNQSTIIKTECINRFNSQSQCNGKCYLKLKLEAAKEDRKNEHKSQIVRLMAKPDIILHEVKIEISVSNNNPKLKGIFYTRSIHDQGFILKLFRPPGSATII